jgi:transcriptional regulator with XRE-family HTH domain
MSNRIAHIGDEAPSRIPLQEAGLQEISTNLRCPDRAWHDAKAGRCDPSRAHISGIENGEVNVSLDAANNLAKAIGCTVIDLLRSDRDQADVKSRHLGPRR